MEQKERDALQRNRIYISENMEAQEVVQVLFSRGLLVEEDMQRTKAETITKHRVYELLDILPRKGPKAFGYFVEALGVCGFGHLASYLKSKLAGKHFES